MQNVILTFYLGTQSMRAALVNKQGEFLCFEKEDFEQPYFSKQSGWAEQRAEFYWEALCRVSKKLKEKAGKNWDFVKGVTLSTIRDTAVCVDAEGKSLRPAILWLDNRTTAKTKHLPLFNRILFKIANKFGATDMAGRTAVCNWLMENEPEIWNKTYKYLLISGYLYYKLVGKFVDSSANIVGHVPFNYKKSRWMKRHELLYPIFPIPQNKLCYLCEPGTMAGYIIDSASNETGIPEEIPLIATGSDKSCDSIGLSCITPEKAAISLGTMATVQYTSKRYVEPQFGIPSYQSLYKGAYSAEVRLYRGYWLASWFKNEFGISGFQEVKEQGISQERFLDMHLTDITPGCNGLVFQPYLTAMEVMPNAKGALIGLSDKHTKKHIYRAMIEGINFTLIEGMEILQEKMNIKTEAVYVSGGPSRSDEICQILADMTGLPVYRIHTHEAGIIGSSIIGFKGLGVFGSVEEGIQNMVHVQKPFKPNSETHEIYSKLYKNVFLHMFERLSPFYDFIQSIEV